MDLAASKQFTWTDALVLAVAGLIAYLVTIPVRSGMAVGGVLVYAVLAGAASRIPGLRPNLGSSALVLG